MADAVGVFYAVLLVAGAGFMVGHRYGRRAERDALAAEVTLGKSVIEDMDYLVKTRAFVGPDVAISRTTKFMRRSDDRRFEMVLTETEPTHLLDGRA